MSSEVALKPFQQDTVDEILKAFKRQDVFALADEVGLGKTLTCAEVAYKQILHADKFAIKRPVIIYYVAPAIELIEQNLKTIKRHLDKKFQNQREIISYTSRVTKVSCDVAEKNSRADKSFKKQPVHLIGLSPATSFKLRGAGMISERAFLAAFFGFNKSIETKKAIYDVFWCLGPKAEDRFISEIDRFSDRRYLESLDQLKQAPEFQQLYQEIFSLSGSSKQSAQRNFVGKIRKFVAKEWVRDSSSALVILDEWHKYKTTCFEEKLMKDFLNTARSGKKTKLLLVSATPFSVKYNDEEEESSFDGSEDLKGLMQLFWGEIRFEEHYSKIKKFQESFLRAAEFYLTTPDANSEKKLKACRKDYEDLLRQFCVRTERTRLSSEGFVDQNMKEPVQKWNSEVTTSLSKFLQDFSNSNDIRSPILSMWQDGHSFPEFKEYKVGKHKKKSIPGSHWKLSFLQKKLNVSYSTRQEVHDFGHAPLWLYPECPLKKYLIFSEFQFLTGEICRGSGLGISKKNRGAIDKIKLGYIPMSFMQGKRDRSLDVLEMKKNYHWLMFYPALRFEEPSEISPLKDQDSIRSVLDYVESTASKGSKIREFRKGIRLELFDRKFDAPIGRSAGQYLETIFNCSSEFDSIGSTIVKALHGASVFAKLPEPDGKADKEYLRKFEKSLMSLGNSFLHLFSSDEALALGQKARKLRLVPKALRIHNEHVAFALWYSKIYQLQDTLTEFASMLLLHNGFDPIDVVNEIAASVNLRKSAVGSRFVRPFNDKKSEDTSHKSDGGPVDRRSLRTAFNSPFPPYVLVTTSVGQEGLDFHRYCDSIIHWSPPSSPNSLKQREGRLDRYRSKQNRVALEKLGLKYPDKNESDRGLCPDFVVLDSENNRINKSDSHVLYLPFSAQEKRWHRCLERSYYNDLLIGAPDPMASEQRIQSLLEKLSKEERLVRLEKIQNYSINLRPR